MSDCDFYFWLAVIAWTPIAVLVWFAFPYAVANTIWAVIDDLMAAHSRLQHRRDLRSYDSRTRSDAVRRAGL